LPDAFYYLLSNDNFHCQTPLQNAKFESFGSENACSQIWLQLECGPMTNVMVALPKIGGALCSTPQSLADAHYLTAVQ